MNQETAYNLIGEFLERYFQEPEDLFLVDLKISPSNQVTVLLDADKGITIEKCTAVNRALYKYLEESELFPGGNFSLEVSSPGVDKPLKLLRQYKKNIGRKVEVEFADGTKTEGTLLEVNEDGIVLEEKQGKGKNTILKQTNLLFNQIKHAIVLVTF
jgi:ribosome maturation factor RimP